MIRHLGTERPVLLSTHLTEDVEHLADTVAVLADGKIRYQGPLAGLATTQTGVDGRPGSPFECAYDDLIMSFGGAE